MWRQNFVSGFLPQSEIVYSHIYRKINMISVVFVIDTNFIQPLEVTLTSIVVHATPTDMLDFHIVMFNPISAEQESRFIDLTNPHKLTVYNFDSTKLEPFTEAFAISERKLAITTMGRLWLPYMLNHLDRVIYLDADIIVLKSLKSLYEIDADTYFSGVHDRGTPDRHFQDYIGLGKLSKSSYINAGVLVMNLKLMRDENYLRDKTSQIVKILQVAPCHDQDVINILYQRRIKLVDMKYNTFAYEQITDDTVIVHFLGDTKPWNSWRSPNRHLWMAHHRMISHR